MSETTQDRAIVTIERQ